MCHDSFNVGPTQFKSASSNRLLEFAKDCADIVGWDEYTRRGYSIRNHVDCGSCRFIPFCEHPFVISL